MCLTGYTPELSACPACGCQEMEQPVLSLERGSVFCRACADSRDQLARLCPDSLAALRYIVSAPAKQLLSFHLEGEAMQRLSAAAERYLLLQTERQFSTLTYWKNIRIK